MLLCTGGVTPPLQPQQLNLQQIQSTLLDDNTLLLEYSLGEKRSYLWAVTKNGISSYQLPKAADIEAAATKFRQQITDRHPSKKELVEAASALSEMILQPVSSQLGNKRLVVVSDRALEYIPFSALPVPVTSGGTRSSKEIIPLMVKHEIVNLPSVSALATLRETRTARSRHSKTLAVFADPVFDANDPRLAKTGTQNPKAMRRKPPPLRSAQASGSTETLTRSANESGVDLKRLPFTATEAEEILKLLPAVQTEQKLGLAANRAAALSPELGQYSIVHFATHGILNSTNPQLSGIVLSLVDEFGKPQNGFRRLGDVYNLKLPVDLVVLSACKTALGKQVKGEGLVGLTRGFMYAGAPRVVMSLWSVDERATSQLMVKFYQEMLVNKLQPAAAMRAAQIEMWKQQQWQTPYYWAAFTVQGEWQ